MNYKQQAAAKAIAFVSENIPVFRTGSPTKSEVK
jgi:hypothetical protein